MRVALAAALFIEPDILMLDEPTNHLDLEAVLWLQNYLLTYPHTVLLVSHDRAFLNEVCTDIVLFKDLRLQYFRGNFDSFEKTRAEVTSGHCCHCEWNRFPVHLLTHAAPAIAASAA